MILSCHTAPVARSHQGVFGLHCFGVSGRATLARGPQRQAGEPLCGVQQAEPKQEVLLHVACYAKTAKNGPKQANKGHRRPQTGSPMS